MASPWRRTLLLAPLLINHGCQSSQRVALLGLAALSSKVPHLPVIVAGEVTGGKLLCQPDGSLVQQWGRTMVELLLLKLPRLELR
jgi:hypothetical protein